MRYESNEKQRRNIAIAEYLASHPEASLKEAGEVFGLTKQRISSIMQKPYVLNRYNEVKHGLPNR